MAEVKDILIIDDSQEDRAYLKHLLNKGADAEWRITETDTAERGLTYSEERRFDCLLLDYRLPDATGIDVINRLRSSSGNLKIAAVLLTGAGDEVLAARAIKAGALDYLSKRGLTSEALVHAVQSAIEKFELIEQRECAIAEKNQALALLESFTRSAPVGFAFLDNDLRFRMANQSVAELNGISVEAHIGRTVEEVTPRAVAEQARATYREMLARAAPVIDCEFSAEKAPGEIGYWSESWYPVRAPDGQTVGVGVVVVETTDRRRAEQTLRENRERLAVALSASGAGTFRWDIRTDTATWDENLCRLFGLNPGSTVRSLEQFIALVHPEDRDAVNGAVERSTQEGSHFDLEFRAILPDGSVRWILSKGNTQFDRQSTQAYMTGACIDITARKQAEEALQESVRRERARAMELAAIMDSFPAVTFIARDTECRTVIGSRTTHEILRVPPGANLSKSAPDSDLPTSFRAMKGGKEIPPNQLPLQTTARTGQPVRNYELDIVYEDGSSRTLLGNTVPLTEENDPSRTRGAVGAFVDITDLKRTEAALRTSNEDLQRFAYVVSHDLQSPLRSVAALTQLLERRYVGTLDRETSEMMRHIQSGVQRMSRLITDLLEYSRISEEARHPVAPIDTASLAKWAVANLQAQIKESDASIAIDHRLPQVDADNQLARVFQNLIGNAIKYRGEKRPEIRVSAERTDDQWVFAVRDNGIGFDMKYADKIFGVFQRLHRSDQYEGTGIGLAVCKKIVERYGGRMWVESAPGEGSTFYFTVPACSSELEQPDKARSHRGSM